VTLPAFCLPEPLTWRELDGVWLVYQAHSTLMMTLEPVAAMVVGLLEDGPADLPTLSARLAQELELPEGVDVGTVVDRVVTPLWHAGLVTSSDLDPPW